MGKSGKKVTKFVTIPNSDFPGLYEMQEPRFQVPNPDDPFSLKCDCCHERLAPVFDVQQLGFWQDHYETYFACRACLKVVKFVYDLSRIEPTPKRSKVRRAAQSAV